MAHYHKVYHLVGQRHGSPSQSPPPYGTETHHKVQCLAWMKRITKSTIIWDRDIAKHHKSTPMCKVGRRYCKTSQSPPPGRTDIAKHHKDHKNHLIVGQKHSTKPTIMWDRNTCQRHTLWDRDIAKHHKVHHHVARNTLQSQSPRGTDNTHHPRAHHLVHVWHWNDSEHHHKSWRWWKCEVVGASLASVCAFS